MLHTKAPPRMPEPAHTWSSRSTELGLNTMAQKSTISARGPNGPSTMWNPAGVCIQLLATVIQIDENTLPRNTISDANQCTGRLTLSHPNTRMPRNPDSRKKAKMPSAASAEPNTSPT